MVVIGHCRATSDGPETAQLRRARLTVGTNDEPRLNLRRRQSATMAGAPTDHARVCLAAPHRPQPCCLCRRPAPDDGDRPSPQLGKLRSLAAHSCADLPERSRYGVVRQGIFHRDSLQFPTQSGAVVVRQLGSSCGVIDPPSCCPGTSMTPLLHGVSGGVAGLKLICCHVKCRINEHSVHLVRVKSFNVQRYEQDCTQGR